MGIISEVSSQLKSSLITNAYVILAMRLLGSIAGMVFWAVAARSLLPADVGLASGVLSAGLLLSGLGQLGLGYGLVRHLPHAHDPAKLLNLTLMAVSAASLVLALAFVGGLQYWSPALAPLRAATGPVVVFTILVVTTALTQLLNWAFLARRRPIYALVKNTAQSLLAIVLLLYLAGGAAGFRAALDSTAIATALALAFAIAALLPRTEPGYRMRLARPATSLRSGFTYYSLSNFASDQISRVPNTLLPLIALNVLGPEVAAYFFVVWAIDTGLLGLTDSLSTSLFAEGSNRPDLAVVYTRRSLKIGLLMATAIALGTVVLSRFVLGIYGQAYVENSAMLLVLLGISQVPGMVRPIFTTYLRVTGRLKALMLLTAVDRVALVGLAYVFMTWMGLIGIGLAALILRLGLAGGLLLWWRRQAPAAGAKPAVGEPES